MFVSVKYHQHKPRRAQTGLVHCCITCSLLNIHICRMLKPSCLACVNGPTTAGAAGAGQMGERKRIWIQAGVGVCIEREADE